MPGSSPLFMLATAADSGLSRFATADDHQHHLQRLQALPAWCEQAATNLREGVRRGIVLPSVILERLLPMLRTMASPDIEKNPFAEPMRRIPRELPDDARQQLAQRYREVVAREVVPAVTRLADVV